MMMVSRKVERRYWEGIDSPIVCLLRIVEGRNAWFQSTKRHVLFPEVGAPGLSQKRAWKVRRFAIPRRTPQTEKTSELLECHKEIKKSGMSMGKSAHQIGLNSVVLMFDKACWRRPCGISCEVCGCPRSIAWESSDNMSTMSVKCTRKTRRDTNRHLRCCISTDVCSFSDINSL